YSLVEPVSVVLPSSGRHSQAVAVRETRDINWVGLACDIEVDSQVNSFEICIKDHNNVEHVIVSGADLNGRTGWALPDFRGGRVNLLLADEQNRRLDSNLGRVNDGKLPWKSLSIRIEGKASGEFRLKALVPIDLTRAMIEKQMGEMKR